MTTLQKSWFVIQFRQDDMAFVRVGQNHSGCHNK